MKLPNMYQTPKARRMKYKIWKKYSKNTSESKYYRDIRNRKFLFYLFFIYPAAKKDFLKIVNKLYKKPPKNIDDVIPKTRNDIKKEFPDFIVDI